MNHQKMLVASETKSATSNSITIFGVPKPFLGDADRIQRNALKSWRRLSELGLNFDVVILGDEPGIQETAEELGIPHIAGLKRNQWGTPILSSAFQLVKEYSNSPVLVYANSDIILFEEFVESISRLQQSELSRFLAIGQRLDLKLDHELDFDQSETIQAVRDQARREGVLSARVCKEYFAFSRDLYSEIPDFAVGRGNWDNWMVASAHRQGIPVVNLNKGGTVIHQVHDYGHSSSNRLQVYVTGPEARLNERLAGGKNVISGACSSWELTEKGLRKRPLGWLKLEFWSDLPRFASLLKELWSSRRLKSDSQKSK